MLRASLSPLLRIRTGVGSSSASAVASSIFVARFPSSSSSSPPPPCRFLQTRCLASSSSVPDHHDVDDVRADRSEQSGGAWKAHVERQRERQQRRVQEERNRRRTAAASMPKDETKRGYGDLLFKNRTAAAATAAASPRRPVGSGTAAARSEDDYGTRGATSSFGTPRRSGVGGEVPRRTSVRIVRRDVGVSGSSNSVGGMSGDSVGRTNASSFFSPRGNDNEALQGRRRAGNDRFNARGGGSSVRDNDENKNDIDKKDAADVTALRRAFLGKFDRGSSPQRPRPSTGFGVDRLPRRGGDLSPIAANPSRSLEEALREGRRRRPAGSSNNADAPPPSSSAPWSRFLNDEDGTVSSRFTGTRAYRERRKAQAAARRQEEEERKGIVQRSRWGADRPAGQDRGGRWGSGDDQQQDGQYSNHRPHPYRQQERQPRWGDDRRTRQQSSAWGRRRNEEVIPVSDLLEAKRARLAAEAKERARQAQQREGDDEEGVMGGSVVLPPRKEMSLNELSSLLRRRVDTIFESLRGLGEAPSQSSRKDFDAGGHRIDIDVAELVALELGFEPTRARRRTGAARVVEDAERRLRRGVVSVGEDETVDGVESAALDAKLSDAGDGEGIAGDEEAYAALPPRNPVVCIMGHVDHGKTTLMDALRRRAAAADRAASSAGARKAAKKGKKKGKKSKGGASIKGDVAGTEAGGITQVISAFEVPVAVAGDESPSSSVTFLDTPGHAAFKSMRRSGSNATDVIVLVVAADDGVSPQTIEILETYKQIARDQPNSISLVVAMTKIDKPGVDVDESVLMIENQLLEQGISTESVAASTPGGDTGDFPPVQLVPVSGMTGEGLEDLIEGLVIQSEVMDLRADEDARAEGIVMDARVEKGLGVVADCIIRWGKLERGDYVVSGVHGGKVKILNDVNGATIKKAKPSQPVRIIGFKTLPKAGDPIVCVGAEQIAKEIISRRETLSAANEDTVGGNGSAVRADSGTRQLELQITGSNSKQGSSIRFVQSKYGFDVSDDTEKQSVRIPVVIKADAHGTLDAVRDALLSIGSESKLDLSVDCVALSIGPVSTSDVRMASESGAAIFVFGLDGAIDKAAMALAESEGVTIRSHDVIYSLLDDAKDVFSTYFPPVPVEKICGRAVVQAVFDVNNKKNAERIAGLKVQEGTMYREKIRSESEEEAFVHFRVLRNGSVVSPEAEKLKAGSLRKVKEDVDDVRMGEECGLGLSGYADIEEGDIIECYSTEMKQLFV